jgi:hypothetical protein
MVRSSFKFFWISVLLASGLAACNPSLEREPGDMRVSLVLSARVGQEDFNTGQIYTNALGYRYMVEEFMSYISMIELVRDDGSSALINDFALVDLGADHAFSASVPAGHYSQIRLYLGVPGDYNKDVDPTQYPNSHPLSVAGSMGMFWIWNTGYIFSKFQGKADLEGVEGNPFTQPFAYHCGDDPLLRLVTYDFDDTFFQKGKQRKVTATIRVDKILDGDFDQIDFSSDFVTHTSGNMDLAERFMNNFAAAFVIEE